MWGKVCVFFHNILCVFNLVLLLWVWVQRKQPFLCTCVSRANRRLVVVLETGRFLKDQLLQPLFGKVVQFHGESEGLLCDRLHVSHTRTDSSRMLRVISWKRCSAFAKWEAQCGGGLHEFHTVATPHTITTIITLTQSSSNLTGKIKSTVQWTCVYCTESLIVTQPERKLNT